MHETDHTIDTDFLLNCSGYHRDFFKSGEFFEPNLADILEVFSILEIEWSGDKNTLLHVVREKLIGKDGNKQPFTHEQAERIYPHLVEMGLFAPFMPPDHYYPVLLVPGGTAGAFQGRLPWIQLLETDQVVIMAGDRFVESPNEIVEAFPEKATTDEGIQEAIETAFDEHGAYIAKSLHETHIARQMMSRLGNVALRSTGQNLPARSEECSKDQEFTLRYEQSGETKEKNVLIMHGKAAERGDLGSQRPTTRSTTLEYLERYAPPRNGSVIPIVVASAGVYTMRMIEEIQRIVRDQGRDDIVIVPAGSAPEGSSFYEWARMALPEVGRLICRSPSLDLSGGAE